MESARARLAELELDYGIEKSKVDSILSKLFAALRPFYQERDRLRLLVQFRKAFIDRLLAEGEEAVGETISARRRRRTGNTIPRLLPLEGKRGSSTRRRRRGSSSFGRSWCGCFRPDLHEQDPEKRKTYELLTQGSTRALACGFQRPR